MDALIMAGGRGTRIASVRDDIPKPMLPVNGKPVLEWQLECLRRQGFCSICLSVGYLADRIKEYFGDGKSFGVSLEYIEETVPLGTAGALSFLRGRVKEDFFLINGDLIFDVDLHRMMAFHKAQDADATILVHPNDHPYDSGVIKADADGRVLHWYTKEEERGWYQNCVNSGIHVLSPRILELIPEPVKTDLDRQILKPQIPAGKIFAYRSPEYIKDMGTPERIAEVERDLDSGLVKRKNLSERQRAVFLDRDGTINVYKGFLRDIDEFELIPGISEAIRRLNRSGYLVIVVTNQPVIARGEVSWEELQEIHNKMETLLGQDGAYIDGLFICPHHPDSGFEGERIEYKIVCSCRKPKPGLLLEAAEKFNIDLAESWMVGDGENDLAAGRAAGCHVAQVGEDHTLLDVVNELEE